MEENMKRQQRRKRLYAVDLESIETKEPKLTTKKGKMEEVHHTFVLEDLEDADRNCFGCVGVGVGVGGGVGAGDDELGVVLGGGECSSSSSRPNGVVGDRGDGEGGGDDGDDLGVVYGGDGEGDGDNCAGSSHGAADDYPQTKKHRGMKRSEMTAEQLQHVRSRDSNLRRNMTPER
jgi:hypothetical protein